MIFNMVGGASNIAGLNFKVVGGTTKPSNPIENTIWVNTNKEITSWTFSATEPAEPTEGMVWFTVGSESEAEVEFNALEKNGLRVYPIVAKQYVGGAWVAKDTKIYQGSTWVSLLYNHIVFQSGSGFVNGHSYSSSGSITLTVDSSKIHVEGTSQNDWGFFNITPKIDLTKYSKLVLTLSVTWVGANGGIKIGVGTSTNTDSMAASTTAGYYSGTLSIDISNVNTSAYILIDPLYCDADITSIKLEV